MWVVVKVLGWDLLCSCGKKACSSMDTNMGPTVMAVLAGAGLALWFLNAMKKQSADGKACSSSASDKCSDGVGEGCSPMPTTLSRSRLPRDADGGGGSGGAGAVVAGNGDVEQEAGQAAMVTVPWVSAGWLSLVSVGLCAFA